MYQYEVVIEVMEENGGYATLGHLYENVLKHKNWESEAEDQYAIIRRIVQTRKEFVQIERGLWALKDYLNNLPENILLKEETSKHTYYQGIIVQIGNLKSFKTYVPNQDKNELYVDKTLGEITTLDDIPNFGYENFIKEARNIDVIWFNRRNMPDSFFEVEFSTDMYRSLIKFYELQDFNSNFYIASQKRQQFEDRLESDIFYDIKDRINFLDFHKIEILYNKELKTSHF